MDTTSRRFRTAAWGSGTNAEWRERERETEPVGIGLGDGDVGLVDGGVAGAQLEDARHWASETAAWARGRRRWAVSAWRRSISSGRELGFLLDNYASGRGFYIVYTSQADF